MKVPGKICLQRITNHIGYFIHFVIPFGQEFSRFFQPGDVDEFVGCQIRQHLNFPVKSGAAHIHDFGQVLHVNVHVGEVFLDDPVELFQVYDLASGALRRVVRAEVERLTVSFPSDVWTAGDRVPLSIALDAGGRSVRPDWRAWLRPLHAPGFRELPWRQEAVTVPDNVGGFCQLRIGAGRDGASDEYTVETIVEVRRPGARW